MCSLLTTARRSTCSSGTNCPAFFSAFLPNGTLLENAHIDHIAPTTKYLPDENGELQPVVSTTDFNVYVSFHAEGTRAEDNAFLLNGVHRLATGDTATLVRGGREFKVDFTKVELESA